MSSKSRTETHEGSTGTMLPGAYHPGSNPPEPPEPFYHETEYLTPSYEKFYESISDTDRWRRKSIDDNDCDHIRRNVRRSEIACSFALKGESSDPGGWFTVELSDPSWAYYAYTPHAFGIDGIAGLTALPTSGDALSVQDYIDRSIRTMLPGIKPKLSILNSIYELKDFKRMPGLLNKTKRSIYNFKSFFQKKTGKSSFGRRTLKQLRRLISEHYLNYSFNVRSLVSDVMGCYSAWQSVGKQIKSLLDNEGKIRVRHYAESYPLFEEVDEQIRVETNGIYTYSGHDLRRVSRLIESSMFRATMVYQYTLTSAQRDEANVRGHLDALGVQLNPAIIWNAIPWSFVVDWVVDVSRFLDQFKEGNLTPTTNILRYCWSVKGARRITNYVNYCVGSPAPSGNVIAIVTDESFYTRRKHSPDWIQWFSTSGLNLREFTYIGALIGSR